MLDVSTRRGTQEVCCSVITKYVYRTFQLINKTTKPAFPDITIYHIKLFIYLLNIDKLPLFSQTFNNG